MSRVRPEASGARLSRREFLKAGAAGAGGLLLAGGCASLPRVGRRRPNILFLHVDQLSYQAISAFGCRHVATPNIDRLAAGGVSFDLSFSANPLCCPARSVWYTGRTASETGVVLNNMDMRPELPDLGQWLGARGYAPVYMGKWHVPGRDEKRSFKMLTPGFRYGLQGDDGVTRCAAAFFNNYRGDRPFFLSVGLLQPHDVCYWPGNIENPPTGIPCRVADAALPPLPANHAVDPREPDGVRSLRGAVQYRGLWNEAQWRYYLWSYLRGVEMVDAQIGRLLDALEDAGLAGDTLLVFSVDHGDGMGAHGLISKTYLYEETVRVPFIVSWPGRLPEGVRDSTHLVSGLDVAPTLCDFAGLEPPPHMRGLSLRPLLTQRRAPWRDFLVSEANVTGRMVRTADMKLITYRNDPNEQFFDLRSDPLETRNAIGDARHAATIASLKRNLFDWESTLDPAPLPERIGTSGIQSG